MPMSLIALFVFVWQPRDDPYYIPTLYVCEQFLGDEIDDMGAWRHPRGHQPRRGRVSTQLY